MPLRMIARVLSVGAAIGLFAPQALAAVLILEGSEPAKPNAPSQTTPPLTSPDTPAASPPAREPASPPDDAVLPSAPSAAPTPLPAIPPGATSANMLDLSGAAPANPAELSVQMLPAQTVSVGSVVSFKITSKKPGYVVLMDVDSAGHLTQIYPNTVSLIRTNRPNGNYVKPGSTLTIPLAGDPYASVRYVVSPPNGQAMIVGILSASPVQLLDLPDIPAELLGSPDKILAYLSKRANELRIPEQDNQLRETKWSFDARPYTIQ